MLFATVNWDGGPTGDGTDFLTPANWVGDALPLAADTAVIGATGINPTITISGTPAVQSITSSRSLRLTGGTLSGGTLAFSGGAALLASTSGGTLSNIAITGDVLLDSASSAIVLSGTTSFTAARLSASNTNLHMRAGYTLNSLVVSEGAAGGNRAVNLGFGGGGTVTFGPSAVVRLAAGSVGQLLVSQSQISTLVNNGLISVDGAGQHMSIQNSALTNNGTLQVSAGTLTVQPTSWTNPGTVTGTGGTFNIAGTFDATAGIGTFTTSAVTVNAVGTINNTGNTIAFNAATGSWRLASGVINNGSITSSAGSHLLVTASAGRLNSVAIAGDLLINTQDASVVVSGTTSFTAARLSASNTSLHMPAGYTLNSLIVAEGAAGGNRAVSLGFGGGGTVTFGPSAIVRLAAGSNAQLLVTQSQISTLVNNGLITNESTGHVSIAPSSLTNNGTLQLAVAGAMTVQPTNWTNPGTVTAAAGTINLGGNLNTATGIGTFTTSAAAVNVGGTITNTGSTFTLNGTTGSWRMTGGTINGGSIVTTGGANVLTSSSGGTLSSVAITGDVLLNTTDAGLTLAGNTSFTAARVSGSNATLRMPAGYTLNSQVVFEGTPGGNRSIQLAFGGAGTVTFGPSAVVRLAAGSVGQVLINQHGAATLVNNGLITMEAAGQHMLINPSVLTNNGTIRATAGTMSVQPPTLNIAGTTAVQGTGILNIDCSGPITVTSTGNATASHFRAPTLTIDGAAAVAPGGGNNGLTRVNSLVFNGSGSLDLNDADLMINYTGGSPGTAIQAMVNAGRNGGNWNGVSSIRSTTAKNAVPKNTTLAVMEGTEYRSIYGVNASFNGFAVSTSALLVKYTYYGDADFNGTVNFDDYARIDNGFTTNRTGWLNGDFDGNGSVNFDDYSLIDLAFNTQGSPLRPGILGGGSKGGKVGGAR